MAVKKRARKKASKKASKKVAKKIVHHRKKASISTIPIIKSSLGNELALLHKIDKKVTRIDHTVNAGRHLAIKSRKAKRRANLRREWEDVERHGME